MSTNKEIVFISHSTHDDDYFAGWLASKLQRIGYRVFVDLEDLRAGDTFYTVIQPKIQQDSVKFITVNTESYIRKAQNPNSGVRREINTASTIKDDSNFFIPVRFDNVDYNLFPMEYLGRKFIDFHNRWGEGLQELLTELNLLKVPHSNQHGDVLELWHKVIQTRNSTLDGEETIYSNWYEIHLPEFIYIHKPILTETSKLSSIPSTIIMEAGHIITFASTETVSQGVKLTSSHKLETVGFMTQNEIPIDESFKLQSPDDKLRNLLNKMFKAHCIRMGLITYHQSGEKETFYFPFRNKKPFFISLKEFGRSRIQLVGNKWHKNWHFAVSGKSSTEPFPHYRLFYHIIFTDHDFKPLGVQEQHQLRRKFSPSLYNKKTFELLAGSMIAMSDGGSLHLNIGIDVNRFMEVDRIPLKFTSKITYVEPDAELSNDLS
jgi:hypothetical protein